MSETRASLRLPTAVAGAAALLGISVALYYARLDLTLSHYDSRGHLVVARRIVDSITPGWQQIGAVWLPLPHLLNALPVQIDALYRSGTSAVALSIASFAVACAAIAWIVAFVTGSWLAALAGTAVFAFNPNVLYLQATPMTEPLLIALTLASIALLLAYCDGATKSIVETTHDAEMPSAALVGWIFALACLTRYEAWPVTIGSLIASVWVLWRAGMPWAVALRRIVRVAVYPAAAIIGFTLFSKVVIGAWFASGFFVPENPAEGRPYQSIAEIVWGLRELSGYAMLTAGAVGAALLAARGLFDRRRAALILPLALMGTAAVPWSAFVDGHPYRIRYMVPLIAVQAVCAGAAAGTWRRGRVALALVLLAVTAYELRPLSLSAPMVVEAQWDRPNRAPRQTVTACLQRDYRGESVMASMGSLGHYMQDLSLAGFSIGDFLHEGNGDIWLNALDSPRPYVGWILIEEKAEGGDMLAIRAHQHPAFLDGYVRVCEGAGLALYRRN